MKTAVVLSDTHGNRARVNALLPLMREADFVFFCGDGIYDLLSQNELSGKLYAVGGNCDGCGDKELFLEIEKKKIFLTHGHRYGVKRSFSALSLRAEELGADIVLFGHTHTALSEQVGGTLFVNPGTLSPYSAHASYAYLAFDEKRATAKIVPCF